MTNCQSFSQSSFHARVRRYWATVLQTMLRPPWTYRKSASDSQPFITLPDDCLRPLRRQFVAVRSAPKTISADQADLGSFETP
jgi:hypothetical protein